VALLRITEEFLTEEFVRHYRLLIERTGNDPDGISRALDEYPTLVQVVLSVAVRRSPPPIPRRLAMIARRCKKGHDVWTQKQRLTVLNLP